MDWEKWLRDAAKRPSDNEDAKRQKTEDQIRKALLDWPDLQGKPFRVYAKGSYANNTNVRLNYDVDIAVEYTGYLYSDLCFELEGQPKSTVGVYDSADTYSRAQFKADILAAMREAFGVGSVQPGEIAYRIRDNKTTLPADVVPCWEYRRYDRIQYGQPVFHVGSRVFPASGGYKDNYPKVQLDNGVEKNLATNKRYKRMVRGLKKLQTKMVADGVLSEELASYFTECLVYNVTNDVFNHSTYVADMRSVLAQIFNATLDGGTHAEWVHVHALKYLFNDGFKRADAHSMASATWDYLGFE